MIVSGRVRIYSVSPTGREQVSTSEGPGSSIAELSVFDGGNYPTSTVTIEQSDLLFHQRMTIFAVCVRRFIVRRHPGIRWIHPRLGRIASDSGNGRNIWIGRLWAPLPAGKSNAYPIPFPRLYSEVYVWLLVASVLSIGAASCGRSGGIGALYGTHSL